MIVGLVEKGYLEAFIRENQEDFASILHYQPATHVLTVEDPQFVFFLRNVSWNKLAERVGHLNIRFESKYDFALSFAGADREIAQRLFDALTELWFSVFYDANEQSRILAENVEDYLAPIYRSEATFILPLLGPDYAKRIWTKVESEQFKNRFAQGAVIPIWFTTAPPGMFDESTRIGGIRFDPTADVDKQISKIASPLANKIANRMSMGSDSPAPAKVAEPAALRERQ